MNTPLEQQIQSLKKIRDRKRFIILFFAVLLLHFLLFNIHWYWKSAQKPNPVELQNISADKLQALKKKWKQRPLIIKKDNLPSTELPPENARYESSKNQKVDQEQRASQTDIMPKKGSPTQSHAEKQILKKEYKSSKRKALSLSNFGVPMFNQFPKSRPRHASDVSSSFADQAILDDSLPLGSENLLNTAEAKYYSFYERIYTIIGPMWLSKTRSAVQKNSHMTPGDYIINAEVVMNAEGYIQDVIIIQSSGVVDYDQAVIQSWKDAKRFPNPPAALLKDGKELRMGWSFRIQLNSSSFFNPLPPQRFY